MNNVKLKFLARDPAHYQFADCGIKNHRQGFAIFFTCVIKHGKF